jgi:hypothetical protein
MPKIHAHSPESQEEPSSFSEVRNVAQSGSGGYGPDQCFVSGSAFDDRLYPNQDGLKKAKNKGGNTAQRQINLIFIES